MKLVSPSVEYWRETSDKDAHVARCAAVCYKSGKYNTAGLIKHLIDNNHLSMFRHASRYYIVGYDTYCGRLVQNYLNSSNMFGQNPYLAAFRGKKAIYLSTNEQYVMEHNEFERFMQIHEVSYDQFLESTESKYLLRLTFCITTSIKVSRELNRVSPNNIAEQSTRYVNFISKNGDVAICESLDSNLSAVDKAIIAESLTNSTNTYSDLIASGVHPEDARRVLPLDTATVCVYTYNLQEWEHILNLRYFETTGKAAPDAKLIASKLYELIVEQKCYE